MSAAIHVEHLSKTYVEGILRRKKRQALKNVSFTVQPGEIFGLLGGNGAGKTTFIKILLGIIRRSEGLAMLLGFPAGDRRARKRVGYLPENLRVPRHLTAITALEYYGHLSNVPSHIIRSRRGPLLERVGLAPRAKDPVRNYSKGMLQRLGLAQAMLHDPDIFILDEPTDGLDPIARSQVRGYLAELKQQGKTVFLNSHILQEVELICDRVAILAQGVLKEVAPVKELTARKSASLLNEVDVHLDLVGEETAIRDSLQRQAVPPAAVTNWQAVADPQVAGATPVKAHSFRFNVKLPDQLGVDSLVDELRRRQVSIVGLTRPRMSLEQAYLEIVAAEVIEK
ncbi:ABC transporter ATP-binding protein [Anatilimnocola floriformis]|uniref:ABC transporter ATP-binding protein n=1 Tax=Anatilimnocola floriformis TaxID=2948575 RepID=UPI0020C2346A|nr:ABC transporter ATP-binding protein [Anatilimnocola floriformis]